MRTRGFTLIELMITVAIAAILASIAYPSFIGAIRKGRRAEAVESITRIQQAQEQWRTRHSSYAKDLATLSIPDKTRNGYYTLAVAVPNDALSASQYTIRADAAGSQVADAKCAFLSMTVKGGQLTYDSTSGQTCWPK
jgi:type IV pilus assembly protein PilE